MAMSEEELLALDAAYPSFPSFAEWVAATEVDEEKWAAFKALLDSRRQGVAEEQLREALTFVARAAAVDTGAIEGLYTTTRGVTITVAQQAAHWQQDLSAQGPLAVELFEAQLRTYELVLDAATQQWPVTEAWIRRLHEEVCAPEKTYPVQTAGGEQQRPLELGAYKTTRNHVRLRNGSLHPYAPVERVGHEMHRLVEELGSDSFAVAHPVHQASYSHYALVVVHPFADGNGRVARALASTYFYRDLSVPLVVLWQDKDRYLDALIAADGGDWSSFVGFVERCGIDAVSLVSTSLESSRRQPLDDAMERLSSAVRPAEPARRVDWATVGHALLGAALDELARTAKASVPSGVEIEVTRAEEPLSGVQPEPGSKIAVAANVALVARDRAHVTRWVNTFRVPVTGPFEVVLLGEEVPSLGARIEEVQPEISAALRLRLSTWAQAVIAEMGAALAEALR